MNRALAFTLALLITASASAFEGNPDRYASVGLDVSNGTLEGEGTSTEYLFWPGGMTNVPVADKTTNEVKILALTPTFRMPASDRLTVEIGMTWIQQDYTYAGYLTRFKGSVSGQIYKIGFRYYFPD